MNGLVLTLDGTDETFDDWGEYSSFTDWFASGSDPYRKEVTSIIIPKGMTRIKQYDFACFLEVCSVTILNPMCEIYDGKYTFGCNTYYEAYGMTIHGYVGSTAEAYAKKYWYDFVPLEDPNPFTGDSSVCFAQHTELSPVLSLRCRPLRVIFVLVVLAYFRFM